MKKTIAVLLVLLMMGTILTACAPEVETIIETVTVIETVEVEVEGETVIQTVEVIKEVEVVVTSTPEPVEEVEEPAAEEPAMPAKVVVAIPGDPSSGDSQYCISPLLF